MFHVLTITYLQPLDVIDQARPAHVAWLNDEVAAGRIPVERAPGVADGRVLVTGDISIEEAQDIMDRDPYRVAGVVRYDRLSFSQLEGLCAAAVNLRRFCPIGISECRSGVSCL